jgi:hypothetical protein
MDTFLTLVIALGGIATGIGAIWAALAARRQGQVSERQAQLTEQSLAQTERSLAEQVQSLREQNERARLNLEYDLLYRLSDRVVSPHWWRRRRAAAQYLLENAFKDGETVEVPSLNTDATEVCNFLEEIGEMFRHGVLSAETVRARFSVWSQAYWVLCKPAIERMREEWEAPTVFEEIGYLSGVMAQMDRERGTARRTQEWLRQFMLMEVEAAKAEEPPAAAE